MSQLLKILENGQYKYLVSNNQIAYTDSPFYDTRDATATNSDITYGKIAYSSNGRIIGDGDLYNTENSTATESDVSTGKVFYNSTGRHIGTKSESPAKEEVSYTIAPSTSDLRVSPPIGKAFKEVTVKGVTLSGNPNTVLTGSSATLYSGINILASIQGTIPVRNASNINVIQNTFQVPSGKYPVVTTKTITLYPTPTPTLVTTGPDYTTHSISYTTTVNDPIGYVQGTSKVGSSQTVSASLLIEPESSITITLNNVSTDVSNYTKATVNIPITDVISGTYNTSKVNLDVYIGSYHYVYVNIPVYAGGYSQS